MVRAAGQVVRWTGRALAVLAAAVLLVISVVPVAVAGLPTSGAIVAHGGEGGEGEFVLPTDPASPASVDDPPTPVSVQKGSSMVVVVVLGAAALAALGVWGAVVALRRPSDGPAAVGDTDETVVAEAPDDGTPGADASNVTPET